MISAGISHTANRIYDIVRNGYVALHEIKALGGFGKEDKSQFDRSLDAEESYKKIRQQILLLNPMEEENTIQKFIGG